MYVYLEHGMVELDAYNNAKTDIKKTKTLGEGALFIAIATGYIVGALFMGLLRNYQASHAFVVVGTIAVVILYYLRIYGIPIPGTEIVITDLTSDWRDVVTKIFQQILVVPASMMWLQVMLAKANKVRLS